MLVVTVYSSTAALRETEENLICQRLPGGSGHVTTPAFAGVSSMASGISSAGLTPLLGSESDLNIVWCSRPQGIQRLDIKALPIVAEVKFPFSLLPVRTVCPQRQKMATAEHSVFAETQQFFIKQR